MDTMTKKARSALMSRIRGDNLKPESRLEAAVMAEQGKRLRSSRRVRSSLAFVRNPSRLPGKPDFLFFEASPPLAVFVHGCFWHRCPSHRREPKTRRAFWRSKLDGNQRRDRRVARRLRAMGISVMTVWEHTDPAAAAARIARRCCPANPMTKETP